MEHHVIEGLRNPPTPLEFKLETLKTLYAMFLSVKGAKIDLDFRQAKDIFDCVLCVVDDSDFVSESESEGASPSPKRTREEAITSPSVKVITHDEFVAGIAAMEERMGTTEEHLKAILALLQEKKK